MAPMKPVYIGRFRSGTECARMIKAPEKIPAHPKPAIARPTMRAFEVGETPQTKDPSSNIPIAAKNTHFKLKNVYIFP